MKQELLEKFADECERLAEEKETEREWLSDYANMVLEEAAKVCDTKAEFMAMMGGSCDPDVLAEQIRALKEPNDLGNRRDAGPIGGASGSPTS